MNDKTKINNYNNYSVYKTMTYQLLVETTFIKKYGLYIKFHTTLNLTKLIFVKIKIQ